MSHDGRPDPEALLERLSGTAAREGSDRRARLKIFFGAAPGVGKTFAMLESARALARQGVDLAVGWVDTHGRAETAALLEGLEVLPRRRVADRGADLAELDVEAAIARRPRVLLVDELAHRNAPGSRHARRWQDVLDLLDAGIDVHTTLDVQHVESLNDVVAQITGIKVRETVPDALLERADEVELIDLPPEELLARRREGKVHVPEQARQAIEHFFQRGNLLALRELALRRTAERVDADVRAYRREHGISAPWQSGERILVGVGASPGSARVIRAGRRMAESLHARWIALYVSPTTQPPLGARDGERLETHLRLAESLGATVVRVDAPRVAAALLDHARRHDVTRIVVGQPTHARWRDRVRGSLLDEVIRGSGGIEVHVIAGAAGPPVADEEVRRDRAPPAAWLLAVALVAITTGLGLALRSLIGLPDLAILYLLAIIGAALGGRGPGILASTLAVAGFDFFFVAPRHTFSVAELRHLLTFAVMFATGLLTSGLIERLRRQERAAHLRERRTAAVLAITRELAEVATPGDAAAVLADHMGAMTVGSAAVLLADADRALVPIAGLAAVSEQEQRVAIWALEHGRPAGQGTDTLPGAQVYVAPLVAGDRPLGVLTVQRRAGAGRLDVEQRHLIEVYARQTALTIERLRLADRAREADARARGEELRSTLLSSVSHDLRTPLATIAGASEALRSHGEALAATDRAALLESISDEAVRLGRILGNVLDLTRIEAGAGPRRQWVALEEIIGSALARLDEGLGDRPVSLALADDLPLVEADPVLLDQLLTNLIENAIRYTPAGSPIEIVARAGSGEIALEVADRGPGLPVGEEERVFEKFWRADHQDRRGAGLGLAIARAVATAHGGSLTANNRDGGGARFVLSLPRTAGAPAVPREEAGA